MCLSGLLVEGPCSIATTPPNNTIRLLLADEHRLVCSAIRHLIDTFQHVKVVAEAGSDHELLKAAVSHQADVALIDAAIGPHLGVDLTARLTELCPGIQVVALSAYSSDTYIRHLLNQGACGFLHKNADVEALKAAIHKAARGERFIFPGWEPERPIETPSLPGPLPKGKHPLTSRQREVLTLIASGWRNKGIAEQLSVSVKTIETHRADIMRRLGVHHTAGLVHEAIRLGLLA